MKTSFIISLSASLLLVANVAHGQGASAVVDELLINATNANHSQVMAILERQLTEAEKQSRSLQDQLSRLGDPKSVNMDAIAMVKEDMLQSATALKTESEQRSSMQALTGKEVFTTDAFGLMTPIGDTVTKADGTVVARDAEKYKMEAAMNTGVANYNEAREAALQRKKALSDELSRVTEQLGAAEDFATIQKLHAMALVLRGQIDECNQTILIARADADMLEKELMNQAKVTIKGKQEEAVLKNKTETSPDGVPADTKNNFRDAMSMPSGTLPWGRKGSATNSGGGAAVP